MMPFFAFVQRIDCKEYVSLITCSSWDLRVRLAITTQDLADLSWSPDSSCFVVWDTLLSYKLSVYSSDGLCLASYSAYQDALGIKTVQWCPTGQLLAVGSFDQVSIALMDAACHFLFDGSSVMLPHLSPPSSPIPGQKATLSHFDSMSGRKCVSWTTLRGGPALRSLIQPACLIQAGWWPTRRLRNHQALNSILPLQTRQSRDTLSVNCRSRSLRRRSRAISRIQGLGLVRPLSC